MRLPSLLACACCLFVCLVSPLALRPTAAANLQFGVRAGWNATSLAIEASEFFVDATAYYQFIDRINERLLSAPASDRAQYDASLDVARSMVGPSSLSVLRSSLVLRVASPAVESLRQMRLNRIARAVEAIPYGTPNAQEVKDESQQRWSECETLIAAGGQLFCDVSEIDFAKLLAESDEQEPAYPFDRVHPSSTGQAAVVLYADPLLASFRSAQTALLAQLSATPFRYILRPVRSARFASAGSLYVQGYGVELATKNMEYKVVDDSKVEVDPNALEVELPQEMRGEAEAAEEEAAGVNGFLFNTLTTRRPELAAELAELKALLLKDSASEIGDKKVAVWDMKDLGFQAAQRVLQARPQAQLEVLRDLAQNFPMYAQALTRTRVNATIKAALERNGQSPIAGGMHRAGMLPPSGTNLMDINGQTVELGPNGDELDIFQLIQLIKSEATSIDQLDQLQLQATSVEALLQHNMAPQSEAGVHQGVGVGPAASTFLLNMDAHAPDTVRILTWLNDIEKDARYKVWPPSLQELLQPGWPNQLKYVRKNMITSIAIIDPAHAKGLDFVTQGDFFVRQNAPVRFGFVFWIPKGSGASAAQREAKRARRWNTDILSKHADGWDAILAGAPEAEEEDDEVDDAYDSMEASVAKVFYHLKLSDTKKKSAGMLFLQALHDSDPRRYGSVTLDEIDSAYLTAAKQAGIKPKKLEWVLKQAEYNELVQLNLDYVHSRGLPSDAADDVPGQLPVMVVNGVVHRSAKEKSFREVLMTAVFAEQQKITMAVYTGDISDRTPDIHQHLQAKSNVFPRTNPAILTASAQMKFLATLPAVSQTEAIAYFTSPDPDAASLLASLTYWLVLDVTNEQSMDLAAGLLEYLEKGQGDVRSRVAIVQNPKNIRETPRVGRLLSALLHGTPALTAERRFELVRQLIMIARALAHDPQRLAAALDHFVATPELTSVSAAAAAALDGGASLNPGFPSSLLASLAAPGESLLVLNGRILPLTAFASPASILADLRLLGSFTSSNFDVYELARQVGIRGAGAVVKFRDDTGKKDADVRWLSEVVFRASYVLIKRALASSTRGGGASGASFPPYDAANSLGMITSSSPASLLHVRVVLDPLSKVAQKLSSVLLTLRDMFPGQVNLQVWLNPKSGITEFPLKRFYRYALGSALHFEEAGPPSSDASHPVSTGGMARPFPGTLFRGLRTKHILSTVVFTPESWDVRLERSVYDLDNLNPTEIGETAVVPVQYHLQHLLLFGQALETARSEPPAGLQLMIGSAVLPFAGDTVVMQNLGYFQLKANPGEWTLGIADARHADIYELQAEKGASGQVGVKRGTRQLFVRSFSEGFLRVDVARRPGQETAQLLDPSKAKKMGKAVAAGKKATGGLWSSVFGSSDDSATAVASSKKSNRTGETIHIFSLASGHLYERFLKIMILSVLQSTRNPVKFWFLANFASPQFLEFIPAMADYLGFEAEFVTYKWPSWLRRQEEKQRIIWGMKILFLDVLFPLAVPRIIYIDADQVVRGDIKELWEMDLLGAPYAYTPFCDSNQETEGFRFWKQGYWKDHLRGKPYHISALYVVDLDQFRLMRAGDSLRGIYDQLSADPNSLANLDQDLPNFAQNMVPIHSLPQSWLWCQTWCSMETLKDAKTVDLCNNPLTKTPKLEVARQLLPEWVGLDARAKALEPIFAAQQQQRDAAGNSPKATPGSATAQHKHDEL